MLRGAKITGQMGQEQDGRNQPIVISTYPIRFLQRQRIALSTTIDNSLQNMNACSAVGCTVVVQDVSILRSGCSGDGCDMQGLVKPDGMVQDHCSCSTMMNLSNLVLAWNFVVTLPSGDQVVVDNFSSRTFVRDLITQTPIRSGTSIQRLQAAVPDIFEVAENVLSYVNLRGGWDAVLWMKRGRQLDRSVQQPDQAVGGYQNRQAVQQNYIVSGDVNYHLVTLTPSDSDRVSWARVYAMKYDTNELDAAA